MFSIDEEKFYQELKQNLDKIDWSRVQDMTPVVLPKLYEEHLKYSASIERQKFNESLFKNL